MSRTTIGDYSIITALGAGGMGQVFLAEQTSMKRLVALKVLLPELTNDENSIKRFFKEVRTLAQIEHPNVVRAIEAGVDRNGTYYFSMDYVEGKDLHQAITQKEGVFAEAEALAIIRSVAQALRHAWVRHKIIHRDIKPGNIMLGNDGEAKLLDLGISKIMTPVNNDMTGAGIMVGSPTYISPEQAKAEKDLDYRTDMYSLGVTYYHMLAGAPPFDATTPMAVVSKHLVEPMPDLSKANPNVSKDSMRLIRTMTEKKKEQRFASWTDAIKFMDGIMEKLGAPPREPDMCDEMESPVRSQPPAGAPKKTATAPLLEFLDWKKMALLGVLLVLVVLCVASFMRSSAADARKKRAETLCNTAKAILAKNQPSERSAAIEMLDEVIRTGDKEHVEQAKAAMEQIRKDVIGEKEKAFERKKEAALDSLRRQSYSLETSREYDKAEALWKNYLEKGEFKDDPDVRRETTRALEYLRGKKEKKQEGLDE